MRNSIIQKIGLIITSMGIQMNDGADQSLFGLTEEQFWHDPTMQKSAANFGKELLWKRKPGIFIDMPNSIHTNQNTSVPVCGFRSQSSEITHRFTLARTCKLIVSDLQTGEIQTAQFKRNPDIQDEETPSPGWIVEDFSFDLLEQVKLESKFGKFTARILCGPESSNSKSFEIYPNKESKKQPEIESQFKSSRMGGGPPYPLLSLKKLDVKFPPQHQLPGNGTLWDVIVADSNASETHIDLKYQVAGLPRFVYPKNKPHLDENGRRVYASLPVQLLAFDEGRNVIISEKFGVPVMSQPGGSAENLVLEGRISLGMDQLMNKTRKPKSLSIWMISKGHFALTELKLGK